MDFLLGVVALAILLLPGWVAARIARVPQPLLAGFVVSTVLLMNLVLAFQVCGIRLTFVHCGSAWLALTLGLAWVGRRNFLAPRADGDRPPFVWRDHWPLFLVLLPALAVVVYRAAAQPLFGIDTIFRWNYLAQQMLTQGSLGFYPPVSGADYEIYSWPDGIAPAVSSLYFWTYGLAGATRSTLTAPVVVFQFCVLVAAVFALTRQLFSARAAVFACALLACAPVVTWATAMGQETGLGAIAVVALLLYLPPDRSKETTGAAIMAGLAAGLGGLTREYWLVLIVFGFGLALARRLSGRSLLFFSAAAALVTVPWYGRNWLRTGNPLFSLDVAGWFPVNQVHLKLMQTYQAGFGWSHLSPAEWQYLFINCCVVVAGAVAGTWFYFRRTRALLVAIALFGLIWAAFVGRTAAGFPIAIRVLSPALALGTILGGAACARWIPAQRNLAGASVALGLLAIDAALRALTLPGTVYKIPPSDWLAAGGAVHEYHQRPIYQQLARAAGSERMLVFGPNALLTLQGARTLPLWSPEVGFLFDSTLPSAEIARRLRAAGIGYALINRASPNERFLAHSSYFRDPAGTLQVLWGDEDMVLFRIAEPK